MALWGSLVVCLALFTALLGVNPLHRCTVTADLVPSCGAWWGMYLPVEPGSPTLAPEVAAEETALGRPLDVIERYYDMSGTGNSIFPTQAEEQLARHHLLLYSWSPAVWSAHTTQYPWSVIASGSLDRSIIVPEAKRLQAFHHTVFLTFEAEPDGNVPAQGSAAQYVAAWRHVHDVFAQQGVSNVVWVWTTDGYLPNKTTIAALYPGNAYVDWIGYDPYNYYTCHHAAWQSFSQTVGPFYRWLMANRFGKPIMLAEFGSAADPADPGREASWFRGIVPALRTSRT